MIQRALPGSRRMSEEPCSVTQQNLGICLVYLWMARRKLILQVPSINVANARPFSCMVTAMTMVGPLSNPEANMTLKTSQSLNGYTSKPFVFVTTDLMKYWYSLLPINMSRLLPYSNVTFVKPPNPFHQYLSPLLGLLCPLLGLRSPLLGLRFPLLGLLCPGV
jgi:hypothetical protein